MKIDYTERGKVNFGMINYVENVIKDFPEKLKSTDTAIAPAGGGLFNQSQGGRVPTEQRAEVLHTMVVKDYSLCTNSKHARPDVEPTISVLYTMMKGPTGADWVNLPD